MGTSKWRWSGGRSPATSRHARRCRSRWCRSRRRSTGRSSPSCSTSRWRCDAGTTSCTPSSIRSSSAGKGRSTPCWTAMESRGWERLEEGRDARRRARDLVFVSCAVAGLALAGCPREARKFHSLPAENARPEPVRLVSLQPGQPAPKQAAGGPYEGNAWAINQGERLYEQYNCVGCHFHGGGGIGPPLMDEKWIYGSEPEQIWATIQEGRPNGRPAFRGKIADYQVWQIAAYVRSMSGQADKGAAPSRDDHMSGKKPEASAEK